MKAGKISFCFFTFLCVFFVSSNAQSPYRNYSYSYDREYHEEPQAYVPSAVLTGADMDIGALNGPQDIFTAHDGKIYIADSGNNRIVILSADWQLVNTIDAFGNGDKLKNPCGIFVTAESDLYIADTDNERIVVFNKNGEFKRIYQKPDSKMFTTEFKPLKIAVDKYERMYIVSRGCEQGFIQLEKDGSFLSYYGAIQTTLEPGEAFWRLFMTEEQKLRTAANIPTVYSNCDVDSDGFVYGTVSAAGTVYNSQIVIRKLNPLGADILKREGFTDPMGDIEFTYDEKTNEYIRSKFVDICVRENGAYSVLDGEKKRIFTYDSLGCLMYVFGAEGTQLGSFKNPVGMCVTPAGEFLVIDSEYNHIVVFRPTEYASLLHNAVGLQETRKYDEAEDQWNEVLKYTSQSEWAYNNLGRIMLAEGRYEEALFYFKLGSYRDYYSVAFKYYRKLLLNDYFYWLVGALLLLVIGAITIRIVIKRRKKGNGKCP